MDDATETEEYDISNAVAYTANYVGKTYPLVERDDIRQEIWLWVYAHLGAVSDYLEGGAHGENKLNKALRNAALKFAQEEKARILGYRPEDNYFYELGLIRDALTRIWDDDAWTSPPVPVDQAKVKHRAVSEGNNYVTTLADVSRVVSELSTDDQALLRGYYHTGYSSEELATVRELSSGAVDARLSRLVKKIQRLLGGERPTS